MTTETSIYEYAKQGLVFSADRPAIWFYGKSITYRSLFEKIDNLADHLYTLGVRDGTVVTIHLPNCPQAVMAVYAVAKLGGICNMLHALVPAAELRENMAFTESSVLITYRADCCDADATVLYADISSHMSLLFRTGYRVKNGVKCPVGAIAFEAMEEACETKGVFPEPDSLGKECVCYLHSSGTTGVPKTVMHSHRALNNWVANAQSFFHSPSMVGETLLEVLPLFHGSGLVMDMHQFITGGGTLVQMAQWNVEQAVRFIKKYKISSLTGVPRVYQDLLKAPKFEGVTIHQGYVSGDYVGTELKKAFNARVRREACLFEGYGMTETVTACFSCGVDHNNLAASGFPLANCYIAVLLPDGTIADRGEGELLVTTNTMMLGYLKDEITTMAVFIERDGVRWLRSGDAGMIDSDGYVYYTERLKNTIIHNGYNVFPAEVEKVIRAVPGVSDVCVVGVWDDEKKTQFIRACVIAEKPDETLKEKIEQACGNHLPRYALPRQILFMEALPRNRMAKVDRKALETAE